MKRLLIILSILLLLGSGYFTYDKWVKHADVTIWSFVPEQSILIYESDDPLLALEQASATEIYENLGYLSSVKGIHQNLATLDSIAGSTGIQPFFKDSPSLIALDLTSSKSFDFLFVIEIQNLSQQAFISKAQAYFSNRGYQKRTRSYLGFTITELTHTAKDEAFTYIFFKNYFIGSFSAFLVEDAIRTVSDDEVQSFLVSNSELNEVAKLEKDEGNIYLNMKRFPALISAFSSKSFNSLNIAKSAFLDLKIKEKTINLTGFTFLDERENYLNNFKSLQGGDFDIAEVVPTETTWLIHLSATEPIKMGENLRNYLQTEETDSFQKRSQLLKDLDFDVNYMFGLIDEEIAIATLESSRSGEQNKLLILEINDMGEALRYINSSTERYAAKNNDSIYVEEYGDYEVRKLPTGDFPQAMLGKIAAGFEHTFYTTYRNYLIFSNSLQQLKSFTLAIENEATWSKSLRINRFLEQTNKAANLSLYFNAPRGWNQLTSGLKDDWKTFFDKHQFTLKNLEFQAYQFSAVDDKFYTNWTLYQPELPKRNLPERIKTDQSIVLVDQITTKPYLVTNHNTQSKEVILQDASGELYLIGESFNVLWSKVLDEPIVTPIRQIDYYKNGKLQYLFATASAVHVIDRTGSYLPEFPKRIPDEYPISALSLIDYKNTRDYRYAIATVKGSVYLTDKDVKPLDGWSPKVFGSPLVGSINHVRIGGKDAMVALQKNGKLNALTRRGSSMDAFPLDLETDVTDAFFISQGNSFENTLISLITVGGEVIEINLNGQIKRRDQLYKTSTETQFELIEDVTGDTYVILRKSGGQYEMLDDKGELLFQKDYFSKEELHRQYYNLGGGVEFFVFVDSGGTFLYLYDRQGNLLTGTPLTASQPISLMKKENEYQIYRVVDRNLELISITY